MSTPQDGASSSRPLPVPMASSPGSNRGRSSPGSGSRAASTARLAASPAPSHFGTSPSRQPPTPGQASATGSDSNPLPPLAGPANSSQPGPGISALAAALSASIGQSPPKFGTPPLRSQSPSTTALQTQPSGPQSNYGSFDTKGRYIQGTPGWTGPNTFEDPEIVKRHLVQPSEISL